MAKFRKKQRINVRIGEDLYRKLKKIADKEEEAISVIVRQLLRESVKDQKDDGEQIASA